MKKLMFLISCLASVVLALQFIVRVLHWPGGRELQIVATVLILILIPLFALDRYKFAITRAMSERLTLIFGAAAGMLYLLGYFIKMVHAPGAGLFLALGTMAFIVALPLLFFTIYRKSVS